jgi:hypothetical protein
MLLPMVSGVKIFIVNVLLLISATIIFELGVKGFRDRLKVTYLFICASMLMFAFGLVQVIILNSLNASGTTYAMLGGANAPYLIMSILAYLGVRLLAEQTLVKSIMLNPWFTFGLATAIGVLAALLPTPRDDSPEYTIHIAVSLSAVIAVIVGVVTAILIKAVGQVSALYKAALGWMGLYYGVIAVAISTNLITQQYLSPTEAPQIYLVGYSIFGLATTLALVAALSFNRIAYAEDDIIKSAKYKTNSSIDVVICLAQFVSNPTTIDSILDDLRSLTASLGSQASPGSSHPLSDTQQMTTARVYLQIEDFLVNKEPVRKFTREQLRQMITIKFKDAVQEPTFWQTLGTASQESKPHLDSLNPVPPSPENRAG